MPKAANSPKLHDFVWALSLANLMLISSWRELIFRDPRNSYFLVDYSSWNYNAAVVSLFLLTFVLFAVVRIGRLLGRRASFFDYAWRVVFLLSCFPLLNYLRQTFGFGQNALNLVRANGNLTVVVCAALALIALVVGLRFFRFFTNVLYYFILIVSPFALNNIVQAGWYSANIRSAPMDASEGTALEERVVGRVLWIIFDEFDYEAAFELRPEDVQLPAFDALRATSFFMVNTSPPGGSTVRAIPGLFLGQGVEESTAIDDRTLHVRLKDGKDVFVLGERNATVFAEAAKMGANTHIIGFHHPYCKIFRGKYKSCHRYAMGAVQIEPAESLINGMSYQLRSLLPLYRRATAMKTLDSIVEQTQRAIVHKEANLVFSHVSVPHQPQIYDRHSQKRVLTNFKKSGYFDNLVLADKTFARFRDVLEEAGLWDSTTIIVSSDHGWGDKPGYYAGNSELTKRIPYFIKMPGQSEGVEHQQPFSSLRTKEIILEVLQSKVQTVSQMREFLAALEISGVAEEEAL